MQKECRNESFLDAAKAWQELLQTEYCITVGRRGKTASFRLQFDLADFPHLAGMQYARDVDFGLREAEYYGEKLVPALLSGALGGRRLEQGRNWEKIKGRLHAILHLKATLESDFLIAWFDPSKVAHTARSVQNMWSQISTPEKRISFSLMKTANTAIIANPPLRKRMLTTYRISRG